MLKLIPFSQEGGQVFRCPLCQKALVEGDTIIMMVVDNQASYMLASEKRVVCCGIGWNPPEFFFSLSEGECAAMAIAERIEEENNLEFLTLIPSAST